VSKFEGDFIFGGVKIMRLEIVKMNINKIYSVLLYLQKYANQFN